MGLLCLTDGLGLGHVVQSYVKEATIAFTACRKLLPDPEFYSQCIQDSFDELLAAAKAAEAAPKASPPAALVTAKSKATGKPKVTAKPKVIGKPPAKRTIVSPKPAKPKPARKSAKP